MDTPPGRLRACRRTGTGTTGERALGSLNRGRRAAASALLLATAIGAAGTTGMSAVFAAAPATLPLTVTLKTSLGISLSGIDLVITEEESPTGGSAAFQVTTDADASVTVDLSPWGTSDAPAKLRIETTPGQHVQQFVGNCTKTWNLDVAEGRSIALAGATQPPARLTLEPVMALAGEVCGTQGTPGSTGGGGSSAGGGSSSSGGSGAKVTPPPTDTQAAPLTAARERHGPALVLGFVLGLLATVLLLARRRGAPRRR